MHFNTVSELEYLEDLWHTFIPTLCLPISVGTDTLPFHSAVLCLYPFCKPGQPCHPDVSSSPIPVTWRAQSRTLVRLVWGGRPPPWTWSPRAPPDPRPMECGQAERFPGGGALHPPDPEGVPWGSGEDGCDGWRKRATIIVRSKHRRGAAGAVAGSPWVPQAGSPGTKVGGVDPSF